MGIGVGINSDTRTIAPAHEELTGPEARVGSLRIAETVRLRSVCIAIRKVAERRYGVPVCPGF